MSTSVFAGARKVLFASIAVAALLSGAYTTVAMANTTQATSSASTGITYAAQINNFTNTDWLNGTWRKSAGFSLPATAANKAAFKVGVAVKLANGQVRKITKAQVVGSNMSIFLDGAALDGKVVGHPHKLTVAAATTAPAPASGTVTSSNLNNFTNSDWLNGVWRRGALLSIAASAANKAAFIAGASVRLADGQVRRITRAQVVGSNMTIFLDGAVLDGKLVGYPHKLTVAVASTAPAPAPARDTATSSNLNNFTNNDWLNGIWRRGAGFSIAASAANKAAFIAGASVRLADGQVRKITRAQVVGSNMSIFLDGAALNGGSLGYPKTVSVTGAGTSAPATSTPPVTAAPAPAPAPAPSAGSSNGSGGPVHLVGVNLSAAGFGPSVLPGTFNTHYTYPAESYYKKYSDLGMKLIRLPFLWERIQPQINGALNTVELGRLMQSLDFAQKHNVRVILDMHNYYRYYGKLIGSIEVPIPAFAATWQRIAQKVVNHPAVYGYGLMNEPYATNGKWPQAALAAARAIRNIDSKRWIFVAGDNWSNAFHWARINTQLINDPWMRDPKNNLVYEAHMYLDEGSSGKYADRNEKVPANLGVERVKPFVEWLKANKLRGYLGEHGVPDFSPTAIVAMDNMLSYLRQNCIPSTYWAAGPWWGEYVLSLDVASGKHRPQLPVLKKHVNSTSCSTIGPL